MEHLLPTLRTKVEVDSLIRDTIDKVLVLRFGLSSDAVCLQLDDVLHKSARDVSKFATVALVDAAEEEIRVYLKYFDITYVPSTVFFFNANHMKMDSGSADHTKWVGAFQKKQDFIDVVENEGIFIYGLHSVRTSGTESFSISCHGDSIWKDFFVRLNSQSNFPEKDSSSNHNAIYRGAMKGKLIVNCPLPPERIPKFQLLYKDV